jgi:hypothetical protein
MFLKKNTIRSEADRREKTKTNSMTDEGKEEWMEIIFQNPKGKP